MGTLSWNPDASPVLDDAPDRLVGGLGDPTCLPGSLAASDRLAEPAPCAPLGHSRSCNTAPAVVGRHGRSRTHFRSESIGAAEAPPESRRTNPRHGTGWTGIIPAETNAAPPAGRLPAPPVRPSRSLGTERHMAAIRRRLSGLTGTRAPPRFPRLLSRASGRLFPRYSPGPQADRGRARGGSARHPHRQRRLQW